jgi:hypothetical protein
LLPISKNKISLKDFYGHYSETFKIHWILEEVKIHLAISTKSETYYASDDLETGDWEKVENRELPNYLKAFLIDGKNTKEVIAILSTIQ